MHVERSGFRIQGYPSSTPSPLPVHGYPSWETLTEVQPILHQEFDVTVVAVRPWGLAVQFQDGTPGVIDNTKDPDWPTGHREAIVGQVLHVAVLDDERTPVRLSALEADLAIAKGCPVIMAKTASGHSAAGTSGRRPRVCHCCDHG